MLSVDFLAYVSRPSKLFLSMTQKPRCGNGVQGFLKRVVRQRLRYGRKGFGGLAVILSQEILIRYLCTIQLRTDGRKKLLCALRVITMPREFLRTVCMWWAVAQIRLRAISGYLKCTIL